MIYYLFNYLDKAYDFPGAGMFNYISFRGAAAFLVSLLIALIFGKKIINFLRRAQIGETVRDLGLQGQNEKAGTPTMGGIIIILATVVPVLLFARLENIYVVIMLLTTLWMGAIGFLDDYIKVFRRNKEGLKGRFKVFGQVGLGILVGGMLYFSPAVTIREAAPVTDATVMSALDSGTQAGDGQKSVKFLQPEKHPTKTTIPFLKNNEFDYSYLLSWMGGNYQKWVWLIFIPIVIFIVTAVSNGANLTDGIDGLAAGVTAIQASILGLFAWLSGNIIFAD